MEKTSKIIRTTFTTEYKSQYGPMYNHIVELENGDRGTISTKDKEPEKLNPGKWITYTSEDTNFGPKIKIVQAKQEGQQWNNNKKSSSWNAPDPRISNIGFSMSYAKDFIVAGKAKYEDLETVFENIYSIMDKKHSKIKGEQHKEEPKPEEKKTEASNEKSTPEQHKRAEAILNEGALFSKEERAKTLEKLKASNKSMAEGMITKLIAESNSRKSVLLQEQEEQESDLPF